MEGGGRLPLRAAFTTLNAALASVPASQPAADGTAALGIVLSHWLGGLGVVWTPGSLAAALPEIAAFMLARPRRETPSLLSIQMGPRSREGLRQTLQASIDTQLATGADGTKSTRMQPRNTALEGLQDKTAISKPGFPAALLGWWSTAFTPVATLPADAALANELGVALASGIQKVRRLVYFHAAARGPSC